MPRYKDPVVAEIKKIRHKISRRLAKAHKEGRLYEEMRAIDREVDREMVRDRHSSRNRR
jgi:hypothetical protein